MHHHFLSKYISYFLKQGETSLINIVSYSVFKHFSLNNIHHRKEKKTNYLSVLGNCYYGDKVDEYGNDSLYAPERSVDTFESFVFVM